MTKLKKNKLCIWMCVLLFLCLIVLGINSIMTNKNNIAYAEITPKYQMTFDYDATVVYKSKISSSYNSIKTYDGTTTKGEYRYWTWGIDIYGTNYNSTTATAAKGQYFAFSPLTISANLNLTSMASTSSGAYYSIISAKLMCGSTMIVNKTGSTSSGISKTIYSGNLNDGYYSLSLVVKGYQNFSGNTYTMTLNMNTAFYIDTTAPTGTLYGGTAIVADNAKTKASYVKFTASDAGSGVKTCYVKKPGETAYEEYASGKQLTEEGTFSFYTVDNANNASAVYTVMRDSTPPSLLCTQSNFGATANKGFTVTASDTLSGAKLFYKTPSMREYAQAGSSYTVQNSDQDGKYYFYAEDGLGNRTDEKWIELKIAAPTATIVRSNTDNGVYATWTDDSTAKLNGQSYTKGTWIRKEGSYTLVMQNSAGRTSTYTFEVGHKYLVTRTVTPTCTTQGYTVYRCTSCADSYTSDFINPKGHSYEETTILPTCIENGRVRHQCGVCGDYYDTDGDPAIGHKFIDDIILATCTDNGGINHTCTVCGFQYQTDMVPPSGHSYMSEVIRAGNCTNSGERKHCCKLCGDTYTTEIPALGHQYEITDVETGDEKTVRTYTCSVCGDSYTQDLGNQYEKVTSYVEYLFNLYSPYMIWVFLGTAGVWSIILGVMIILARKNEDKEKAKKMLVNYIIGLVVIFCILVACPFLVKGIAALIT